MVTYLLVRRLRTRWARAAAVIAAITWAFAMGLSRVFLGHHWLTDVIFAWLLGARLAGPGDHLPPALPHYPAR
jgi:membrane-associated phospholipid phosphatase